MQTYTELCQTRQTIADSIGILTAMLASLDEKMISFVRRTDLNLDDNIDKEMPVFELQDELEKYESIIYDIVSNKDVGFIYNLAQFMLAYDLKCHIPDYRAPQADLTEVKQ